MANPEHVDLVKQGFQALETWRLKNFDQLDLSDADLRGADLSGCNLSSSNLTRACMDGAQIVNIVTGRLSIQHVPAADRVVRRAFAPLADYQKFKVLGNFQNDLSKECH